MSENINSKLWDAASNGNEARVILYIEQGAEVDRRDDVYSATAYTQQPVASGGVAVGGWEKRRRRRRPVPVWSLGCSTLGGVWRQVIRMGTHLCPVLQFRVTWRQLSVCCSTAPNGTKHPPLPLLRCLIEVHNQNSLAQI